MLINKPAALKSFCDQARAAAQVGAPLAFDTEFLSERRYSAQLCLIQLFIETPSEPLEALVDPFEVDLAPLLELIADESITKIVHAGGQDLQILCAQYACTPQSIFDTQIAGAFLGYGHQIGYSELVRRLVPDTNLSKEMQFTNWAARPLTAAQMEYALADVRYLPPVHRALQNDLQKRGRLDWAETEFRRAQAKACAKTPPEELFWKFNVSGLSRRALAFLRELAAARDELARHIDKPPSFIVPDATLLQMAKQPPKNANDLRGLRGMPNLSNEQARAIQNALERAAASPESDYPKYFAGPRPDARGEAVASLFGVVAQLRADEHQISRSYLSSRDQLNALAAWWMQNDGTPPPDIPLLSDWRRELLGAELLQLMEGQCALTLDGAARIRAQSPVVRVVETPKVETPKVETPKIAGG